MMLAIYAEEAKKIDNTKLARLTGSPKQIAWAEDIRASIICRIGVEAVMNCQQFIDAMNCATEASWWIDNDQEFVFGASRADAVRVFEQFLNK